MLLCKESHLFNSYFKSAIQLICATPSGGGAILEKKDKKP